MKTKSYFSALVIAAGLISSTIVFGLNTKDSKETAASQQQTTVTKTTTESAWLNTKNFPQMPQGTCPFYIAVKPGC